MDSEFGTFFFYENTKITKMDIQDKIKQNEICLIFCYLTLTLTLLRNLRNKMFDIDKQIQIRKIIKTFYLDRCSVGESMVK